MSAPDIRAEASLGRWGNQFGHVAPQGNHLLASQVAGVARGASSSQQELAAKPGSLSTHLAGRWERVLLPKEQKLLISETQWKEESLPAMQTGWKEVKRVMKITHQP